CTICSFSKTDRRRLPRRPTTVSSAWIMQTSLSAETLSRQWGTSHAYDGSVSEESAKASEAS
ncbi:MAG TPA: hypothetical protein VMV57_06875, partial [Terracidiphilus sp.]|nr:hypothetical protein [Terracidiphilus sp.]